MNNNFYIHSGMMDEKNIATCLNKTIELCKNNNIQNIKMVLNNKNIIDNSNFISKYISRRMGKDEDEVSKHLKKYNGYRLLPEEIGINILHPDNFSLTIDLKTTILIIYSYPDILKKLLDKIKGFNHDVVLCLPNETEELKNEIKNILKVFAIYYF